MEISQHIDRFTFVPNFFTLNINDLSDAKLKVIQQRLKNNEDKTSTSNFKLMNSNNLLSFVSLLVSKYSDCESQNTIVLKENPCNINANVIKSLLCFNNAEISNAESYIDKIKSSSKDDFLVSEAKAEMAYAYSRFGGRYYNRAIEIYYKVTEKYPKVYEWKYQLALTMRRCLSIKQRLINIDMDIYFPKCIDLLTDIIDNSDDTNLEANAYVQKACLLLPNNSSDTVLQKNGIAVSDREENIEYNLEKAMELSTEDDGMLQEVGRCYKNIGNFQKAKQILKKAINICPASTSYHQLALCLIKLEGYTPDVIYSLEKYVEMNGYGNLQLGIAYMKQKIPDYTKALEMFESCLSHEYNEQNYDTVAWCYENMAQCYLKKANTEGVEDEDRTACNNKFQECRRRSAIKAAIYYLGTFRKKVGREKTLKIHELFSNHKPAKPRGDVFQPKDTLIHYVYYNIQQKCDFICEVKDACSSNDAIHRRIQNYVKDGQLSECLDMMILMMTTDFPGIESIAIETIGQIIYESVLQSRQDITQNCMISTIRCFCYTEHIGSNVRIIYDDNSETEADRMEEIITGLDLSVIRNKMDILPFMNPEEALHSAMSNNNVVLYIVKDNNTDLLEEYPVIRQLPISKPMLIPITVEGSFVPDVLRSHTDPMEYPNPSLTVDGEEMAIWYKTFFETIFKTVILHC